MEEDDRYTRITLRIPKDLHTEMVEAAAATSKSLNAQIVARLQRASDDAITIQKLQHEAAMRSMQVVNAREKLDETFQQLDKKNSETLKMREDLSRTKYELEVSAKEIHKLRFALDDRPDYADLHQKVAHLQARLEDQVALVLVLRDAAAVKDELLKRITESQNFWITRAITAADRLRGMFDRLPENAKSETDFIIAYEAALTDLGLAAQWSEIRSTLPRPEQVLKYTAMPLVEEASLRTRPKPKSD